ncbi:MAG: hypothetical protein V3R81_02900 [Gammaproteobacteria bacterium]
MPFEDPKFISDLVITNPTSADLRSAGDQHLRALRLVLIGDGTDQAGSFTSNFTGQYTGTAAELQSIRDQIIPDPLPEDGDLLVWDTDKFVAQAPQAPSVFQAAYGGYAGVGGSDEVIFTTEHYDDVPTDLCTIENPAAGGGWRLTALKRCTVNLNFTKQIERTGGTVNTGNVRITKNAATVPLVLDQARQQSDNGGGNPYAASSVSASLVLEINDTLSCIAPSVSGTQDTNMTLTVQEVA